ncbi:MAG: deoxyribodipyrimidine photo-lyase [Pleurocapsa sp. SU_196_0]|nr:deoxyribodipyrimidine photo-lyase [Pleurocapsa sp. SU_196_0]
MILVWHRGDLRTHDHPALHEAAAAEGGVAPCFVLDPSLLKLPYSGNSRIAFLYANLRALDESYRSRGSGLVVRAGKPEEELLKLARESAATAVYALRSYEPVGRARDERVKRTLEANGVAFRLLDGDCILEPGLVRTQTGGGYKVFTPFWRNWSALPLPAPLPTPKALEPHGVGELGDSGTEGERGTARGGRRGGARGVEEFHSSRRFAVRRTTQLTRTGRNLETIDVLASRGDFTAHGGKFGDAGGYDGVGAGVVLARFLPSHPVGRTASRD